MKSCVIQLLNLLHIIQPNIFLKKFLSIIKQGKHFSYKLTCHCFTQVTVVTAVTNKKGFIYETSLIGFLFT